MALHIGQYEDVPRTLHWNILRTSYFNVLWTSVEDILRTSVGDVPWRYIVDHRGISWDVFWGRPRDVILPIGSM